jgi:FKBP-type peptidyl-prolyl cis-trans isomerase
MKQVVMSVVAAAAVAGAACSQSKPSGAAAPAAQQQPAGDVVTAPNGLVSQVLKAGTGDAAKKGDKVRVHYVGTFPDGKKFDSSRDRGEPFVFRLGAGMVIPGWDLGVEGMKEGELKKLTLPPSLGYGGSQVGPIPPNSTLVFEVELVEVI